jgi:hypothetical protein
MTQKVVTNDEAVTGSKIFFVAIFGTFGRYITNLRGTFVENVKKVENQPTLLSKSSSSMEIEQLFVSPPLQKMNKSTFSLVNVNFRLKFRVIKFLWGIGFGFRSGPSRFKKSDPDPDENPPDPQHWVFRNRQKVSEKTVSTLKTTDS